MRKQWFEWYAFTERHSSSRHAGVRQTASRVLRGALSTTNHARPTNFTLFLSLFGHSSSLSHIRPLSPTPTLLSVMIFVNKKNCFITTIHARGARWNLKESVISNFISLLFPPFPFLTNSKHVSICL